MISQHFKVVLQRYKLWPHLGFCVPVTREWAAVVKFSHTLLYARPLSTGLDSSLVASRQIAVYNITPPTSLSPCRYCMQCHTRLPCPYLFR